MGGTVPIVFTGEIKGDGGRWVGLVGEVREALVKAIF